jgi:hypothetical protein
VDSGTLALTGVEDGGVDGVAAGEEEAHEPRADEAAGAGDQHRLPHHMSECRTIEWWGGYQKQILWARLVPDSTLRRKVLFWNVSLVTFFDSSKKILSGHTYGTRISHGTVYPIRYPDLWVDRSDSG